MRVIDAMLREVAEGTEGIKYYNHAPRAYANAEESKFPRIWVYDTRPIDVVSIAHSIATRYMVVMEISDLVDLDGEPTSFETALDTVEVIWWKFINRLSRDSRNQSPIKEVQRIEILHSLDNNVAGYLCTFTLDVATAPVYQCP